MLKLVRPNIKYKRTYLQAASEHKKVGRFINVDINEAKKDFKNFVNKIKSRKFGFNLPPTYPNAEIEYWLIDNETFIGRVGVRTKLNKNQRNKVGHIGISIRPSKRKKGYGFKGFKLALNKAKFNGLKKVLLICKDTNIASQKMIERLGGKLIEKYEVKNEATRLRYIVKLDG